MMPQAVSRLFIVIGVMVFTLLAFSAHSRRSQNRNDTTKRFVGMWRLASWINAQGALVNGIIHAV